MKNQDYVKATVIREFCFDNVRLQLTEKAAVKINLPDGTYVTCIRASQVQDSTSFIPELQHVIESPEWAQMTDKHYQAKQEAKDAKSRLAKEAFDALVAKGMTPEVAKQLLRIA